MAEFIINGIYYLPFWVIQQYMDTTPPDPFMACKLVRLTDTETLADSGVAFIPTCEIEVKTGLIIDVPRNYLIRKDQLNEWAARFAQWFVDFAKIESQKQ